MTRPLPNKGEPLTPQQDRVMAELAKGLQAKEIAWDMKLSRRTVETHIQCAKAKLGARNIVQAAVIYTLASKDLKPTCGT